MITDMRYFLVLGIGFLATLIVLAIVHYRRSRRASGGIWEELLGRLIMVDHFAVQKIALDAIDTNGNLRSDEHAKELQTDQIWELIGGLKGVEALQHNSRVFVDMAAYLQSWYPEALPIAEELRQSARQIEWHVNQLKAGARNANLDAWFRAYAQNAGMTYYLMTQRLLLLFESGNSRLLGDLRRAL